MANYTPSNEVAIQYLRDIASSLYELSSSGSGTGFLPVYNVKSYGATGNGTTDDTTAIQTAINAAFAAGGGTVFLPAGTYVLSSSLQPKNGITIQGAGMFYSTLTTVSGATFAPIDNYNNVTTGTPNESIIFTDFEIDGSHQLRTVGSKGINMRYLVNCQFRNLYVHDTTATGIGADDWLNTLADGCIVNNCGYNNPVAISALAYSTNTFTITFATSLPANYTVGHAIVITGCTPAAWNGVYNITTINSGSNQITIATSNNNTVANLTLSQNPGTATIFGQASDSILGQNGIGIATGALPSESGVISNCFCNNNQNNNFLYEADTAGTGDNASYTFINCNSRLAGSCGFRNTGSPNVAMYGCFDYGSPIGFYHVSTTTNRTITGATWLSNVATYTTSVAHGFSVGQYVMINSISPSGYNGAYYITSVPTTTTFTVAITSNPGTYTSGGQAQIIAHGVDGSFMDGCTATDNTWIGVEVSPQANGVSLRNSTVENCLNWGLYWGSGLSGITGNRIHDNGIEGIYVWTGATEYIPLDELDISNNHIYNNGKLQANKDGISINSNGNTPISNLRIASNNCFDNQSTKTQRYGIIIRNSGNNSNVEIVNNNVLNNFNSAGMLLQDTGGTIRAHNNRGYNPIGLVAVSIPSSGTATTAAQVDETFYITAGSSTCACSVTNAAGSAQTVATIPSSGFGAVFVPAGSTLTPTYSSAPTWTVQAN